MTEFDEICVRFSPGLWLWIAVSRLVGQVLGLALGPRSDKMLARAWTDVPQDYRNKPVFTDHWEAYSRFFGTQQHTACDKGSGKTSHVEAWNTKWRQRQSGLVRRSCGVCERIQDDILERFMILVEQHNRERSKRWNALQEQAALTTP